MTTQVAQSIHVGTQGAPSGATSLDAALRAGVRVAELISALPAVATQDWCDRASAALLPIVGSGIAQTMIAQIDDKGGIARQEATGVAGCTIAEIGTSVGGRDTTSLSTITLDPNDALLAQVRTVFAQAHELSWSPGHLLAGEIRVGTAANLATRSSSGASGLAHRWEGVEHGGLLLGAAALGAGGRLLVVEIGATRGIVSENDVAVLRATLPALARRAVMAIGQNQSEAAHWLTQREQIILQHLLLGKSVREIADELGRSPHTVHDHVKSLHKKLNASSRGELVARALGYVEGKPSAVPKIEEDALKDE